jgi:serine/threonine protein kinase
VVFVIDAYAVHSVDVVHGDLQPVCTLVSSWMLHLFVSQDNGLIDDSGIPRLTGFGLATVVGNPELQLNSTTVACDFNARWRAPEVMGIESDEPARPTCASNIYSFGSVMFFVRSIHITVVPPLTFSGQIISGNIPWKERNSYQIAIALSNRVIPARPENIPNDFWNLIERCWSQNPVDRPGTSQILDYTDQCRIDGSPVRLPKIPTYSPQESDSGPPPL